jgi:hypothetical protein
MISKISCGYIVALENSVPPHVTTDTKNMTEDIFLAQILGHKLDVL